MRRRRARPARRGAAAPAAARLGLALLLGIVVLAAPAEAAPCVFEPIPVWMPGTPAPPVAIEPSVLATVRGAGVDAPFRLEARATGAAVLRWQRPPHPTDLRLFQRLTVTRSSDDGASFTPFCETDWIEAGQLSLWAQMKLVTDVPVIWRVEIHEENRTPTVTVLDEERPVVILRGALEGGPVIAPQPLPGFDGTRPEGPSPIAACPVTSEAGTSDAVPVKTATIAEGGLQITGTIYAVSGRTLHVRIERGAEGPPVRLLLKAKPLSYGIPPRAVCAIVVDKDALEDGEWITATVPWAMVTEFRWFITLDSKGRSPPLKYAVHRERPHSMAARNVRRHGTDAYSCLKAEVEKPGPVDPMEIETFQGAYAVTVRTNLHKMGVTGEAYQRIVDAILTGIDSWRIVCIACTPYQFSIVDIDGEVHVAAGLLHGSPENYRATFIANYPWDWRLWNQKSTGLFTPSAPFERVSGSLRQRQRFCLQMAESETGFSAAESPLCRPSPPSSEQEMIVNLAWRTDGLSCDARAIVVACWNGSGLIELNLRDYAFYVGDTGDVLLGASPKGADLVRVFTHEVGHWLGLGHMSGGGNMMSDELEDARCIDDRNMRRINAVARGEIRRTFRPEALRYE